MKKVLVTGGTVFVSRYFAEYYVKKGYDVYEDIEQRQYFSFYNYAYALDVTAQSALMPLTTPLSEGLRASFLWYRDNSAAVNKKPLFDFIDNNLQ